MKIIRTTDFDLNQCEEVELPSNKYEAMSLVKSIIGGYLEFCTCHLNGEPCYVFCDDNGKIKGKPINMLATSIYDYNTEDCIVGDVVFMEVDEFLDFNNKF